MNTALDEVRDREALRELIARYAHYVARADAKGVAALFTPEGAYRTRNSPVGNSDILGRAAIEANLSHLEPGSVVPLVGNVMLKLDRDHATGASTLFSPSSAVARGGSPTRPFYGIYQDSFERTDGSWFFAERVFTYLSPASSES